MFYFTSYYDAIVKVYLYEPTVTAGEMQKNEGKAQAATLTKKTLHTLTGFFSYFGWLDLFSG